MVKEKNHRDPYENGKEDRAGTVRGLCGDRAGHRGRGPASTSCDREKRLVRLRF